MILHEGIKYAIQDTAKNLGRKIEDFHFNKFIGRLYDNDYQEQKRKFLRVGDDVVTDIKRQINDNPELTNKILGGAGLLAAGLAAKKYISHKKSKKG